MHFKNTSSYFVDTEINSLFSPLSQSTASRGAEWLLTCNLQGPPWSPEHPRCEEPHYHSNPRVPQREGQQYVGSKGGHHCTQNPDDVLPCFIHHEPKYWGHGSWYDIYNTAQRIKKVLFNEMYPSYKKKKKNPSP